MTESPEAEKPHSDDVPETFPWLRAVPKDLVGLDFEAPIAGLNAADSGELADHYRTASRALSSIDSEKDSAMGRVWNMLWGLTAMHFKPADVNEPFGPMLALASGARSAIPSDFRGHVDMLETMALTASNIVLKARLCDLVWLLDRKKAFLGSAAVEAYVEIVRLRETGDLKFRYTSNDGRFHHETHDYLLRAFGIAWTLGRDKPTSQAVQEMLVGVRKRAIEARDPVSAHWFCSLDLGCRVSDPADVAADLEAILGDLPAETTHHVVLDLWRLAARAYELAKRNADVHRCKLAAAETMVAQANVTTSAMLASHFVGNAIAALHGVPGAKERRLALRHRLVDVQAGIADEMSTFAQMTDLNELAEKVRDSLTPLGLVESLFVFAALHASPDPAQLDAEAEDAIRKHPLSTIFGSSHHDSEGKVIHRTAGSSGFGNADASTVRRQVAQAESTRRHCVVSGMIEPARHNITGRHYLSDDVFRAILQYSPFVPSDLTQTFARGFTRFFQGDLTCALYILTPLLENSLRHVLKAHGHDVTTFDDATQTQEDRTISSLFDQMRSELDAVFTRAIVEDVNRVFLAKPGPYLRHAVAHGLLQDGGPYGTDAIYGCWLVFRLCLIPLFPHREQLGLT